MTASPVQSGTEVEPASAGPGPGLALVVFFFLMLGMGWLPETWVKIPAFASASIGELLLIWAAWRGWRAARPRTLGMPHRTAMDGLVILLLALVTFNVVRNIGEGYPAIMVLRNARRMYYYLFFFVVTAAMADAVGRRRLVDGFNVLLMIGAAAYAFTRLTGVPLASRIALSYTPAGEPFERVYSVIFPVAVVAGLLNFALLLSKPSPNLRIPPSLGLGVASVLLYLSFYRNYFLSFGVGLLAVLIASSRLRWRQLIRATAVLAALFTATVATLAVTGMLQFTVSRLATTRAEVMGAGGTLAARFIIWGVRYDAITQLNPVFGAGFIWERDIERTTEDVILDPLVPDNDSGYGAALVLLGYVGIVMSLALYLVGAHMGIRVLRRVEPPVDRAFALVAIALAPYVALNNIGLDNFHWPYAVLPNLVVLGGVSAVAREHADRLRAAGPGP